MLGTTCFDFRDKVPHNRGGGTVCWMRQGLGKVHVLHCMRHVHACMNMRTQLKPHQLILTLSKYHFVCCHHSVRRRSLAVGIYAMSGSDNCMPISSTRRVTAVTTSNRKITNLHIELPARLLACHQQPGCRRQTRRICASSTPQRLGSQQRPWPQSSVLRKGSKTSFQNH